MTGVGSQWRKTKHWEEETGARCPRSLRKWKEVGPRPQICMSLRRVLIHGLVLNPQGDFTALFNTNAPVTLTTSTLPLSVLVLTTFHMCVSISISPTRTDALGGQGSYLSWSRAQCLAHIKCSINICGLNKSGSAKERI